MDGSGLAGVGIIMTPKIASGLLDYEAVSDRIVMARLKGQSNNLKILSVYAPIRDAPGHLKDKFYADLQLTMNKIPRKDILVIGGDFNARIGTRLNDSEWAIGNHGLGDRCINGVCFHFQTRIASNDDSHNGEIVDDSRKFGQPFELLIGKEFKLEVWESAVRMMGIGEVAIFSVEPNLVSSYPFVSKTLRDMYNKTSANKSNHHCCGMLMTDNATIGYEDLDQLLKEPKQLEFTIELLSVELPGDYNKEIWQMEPDEKLSNLSKIKESGNELYKNKEYELEKTK
ncbi:hypothetical protein QYM36_014288 [Artemia franciscana]|uniref:peptidylprolyl isomerase n=1 Tax=Artemia franciscana TaxID=6661 RepID=A0AA88HJD3_ARTSF|nr:hypothetical protein QYM36_014288 [Artemia franciscana]